LRRRAALLDFARRKRATIVEDDYDGEFRFDNRPLDALQMLDRGSSVFYVGTFSKSLFPSLRKGFIVAPGWARDNVVTIKQCADSNCDAVGQSALAAFIRDGHLARHVRRMTPIYAERRDALLSGLQEQLHEWFEPIPCTIGLHLAARIRTAGLASRVVSTVAQLMPGAQSTADYAMRPGAHTAIAFGYGVIDADEIRSAVTRLARALRKTA
jgi:GntR family transcriptional regulator/MocR family aminotransferase